MKQTLAYQAVAVLILLAAFQGRLPAVGTAAAEEPAAARIPVIFDTDIGDDIDDTWALAMLLKSPQFDVKLITTTCGASQARGKLVAKLLTVAGRTDVAVGLGPGAEGGTQSGRVDQGFQVGPNTRARSTRTAPRRSSTRSTPARGR